jgi:hypothetical protein
MSSASHNAKLFINYRREDTAPYAGRLYDRLTAHFGAGQVFIDIDQIEPGEDFVEAINNKVGACEIAIVSIGPDWLSVTNASGQRRIDDTEDFVRMEIVAALQRKIRVIPVLMGGARMPTKQDLPEELAPLSRRNAIELSETRFHADVDRLIEAIEKPRAMANGEKTSARRPETSSSAPSRLTAYILIAAVVALTVGCFVWFFSAHRRPGTVSNRSESLNPAPISAPLVPAISVPELTPSSPARGSPSSDANAVTSTETPNPSEEDWMPDIRKRAESGSAEAQFIMGTFYELGFTSIPADSQKAMQWYRKAAEQGHALAREGLEDLSNEGTPKSENNALQRTARRTTRQERSSSAVLDAMDAKARDGIKKMKQ